ncbi:GNAT family N-acetyltransferase [Vibrio palustris]|uniref:N-acyltransferase YncA n=1 Tax=Vibrio palustris TaxID=1918946 RepID=A0A1R4B4Y8_9VIBR|nr:GNAT family N-acetyltransferase [Vibrio palustris]SJL83998.1 N-acyltransferase YncA [Vibrio palustris]
MITCAGVEELINDLEKNHQFEGIELIRHATPNDVASIVSIYNHAIEHTTATYDCDPYTAEQRLHWFESLTLSGMPILVYEEANNIIGYAALEFFRQDPAYRYTGMHSIYIDPKSQGKGLGRQLVTALIAEAEKTGFVTLVAEIDGNNQASMRLHEQLGFTYSGKIQRCAQKFDQWLDLVFYQYDLRT